MPRGALCVEKRVSIEVALMIEGQDGVNWDRFQRIARVAEDEGFVGFFRSDHFTNPSGPYKDSLECWISLAWLATNTSRIVFGPLVSPVSFRHPSMLVRQAAAVSDLSGGRLVLGIGAGWQDREHVNYSYHLGDVPERMARFSEATQIMSHLLRSEQPLTFQGRHYQLHEAVLLPRPAHQVPIVIGGSGKQKTLPLAARYADEWNTSDKPPEQFQDLNAHLDSLLDKAGRPRSAVRRSVMTFIRDASAEEVRDRVQALEAVGVQRVMLNWPRFDDLDGIRQLARTVMR
jgi:F420-dependent oxidoreductase-like protein